ncbi:MAG: phosphohistidine phosphatase SixA [Candidatus Aminicenantes bacterium]|nr:MAG: phosphohistidine phosphatase SixA [Candidatus Aminicenantes bacterium]
MVLYLIQHGEAKSKQEDPERPLTDKGAKNIKKTAAFFKELKREIGLIWHSGKKRAEQTAEILKETLGADVQMETCEGLAPNDDISIIIQKIETADQDSIILVGHLPHLSRLASRLLAGNQKIEIIRFKNAGILCLSGENQDWELEWMITPGIILEK